MVGPYKCYASASASSVDTPCYLALTSVDGMLAVLQSLLNICRDYRLLLPTTLSLNNTNVCVFILIPILSLFFRTELYFSTRGPRLACDLRFDARCPQGFIQDLLCGQGVAQALYQWMTEPLESQLPVLHATSLATQGQGWGSYQALSSQPATASRVDATAGNHRRRRSRVLSSGVDAAGRALVAVTIKCNGAVTEAATFARQVEKQLHQRIDKT